MTYGDTEMLFIDRAKAGQGLFAIAAALNEISKSLDRMTDLLGTNNAATQMGAIEALGKAIEDGLANVAGSIDGIGESIGAKD